MNFKDFFVAKLSKLLSLVTQIFPISKKIWLFNSFPDFTDNSYGFFYKSLPKRPDIHFVWLVSDKAFVKKIRNEYPQKNVSAYTKRSLLGFWYFLRAGFVFVSHGIFDKYRADKSPKIVVGLWHGMPLKKICWMDPTTTWVTYTDYVIATSELFQNIMGESFRKDKSHTLLVGQPRNDLLFEKTDFFEKQRIDRTQFEKVGLWLPTYRNSSIQNRTDGTFHEGQLLFFKVSNLKDLNDFLVQIKHLLIVKIHPMDSLQDADLPSFSNLRIVKQKDFTSQLYPLLGNCDYLLTDFSSVWLDYEILGKPIGFVCDDFEAYEKGRGFTVPNLVRKLPGPLIENVEEMKAFLSHLPETKIPKESVFNLYKDACASERLLDRLSSLSK